VSLIFLAVWHGLHSGYYMCFFMEFLTMNAEKQFESILSKNAAFMRWHNTKIGSWIDFLVVKIFVMCYFGFCMIPFILLKYRSWGPVYYDLYYNGLLIFGLFPAYAPLLRAVFSIGQEKARSQTTSNDVKENGREIQTGDGDASKKSD